MVRRGAYPLIAAIAVFFCVSVIAAYYFFFTAAGSRVFISSALFSCCKPKNIVFKTVEGNLLKGITLNDLQIDGARGLPEGSSIKIQELKSRLTFAGAGGLRITVFNGRLNLPGSESIYFYGAYEGGALDFRVYSNSADVSYMVDLLARGASIRNLSGTLRGLDIRISGSFTKPEFKGEFHIEKLTHANLTMADCRILLFMRLSGLNRRPELYGKINLENGKIWAQRTATVELRPSSFLFSGAPQNPRLNLNGRSEVGNTKIEITLRGDADKPDLKLESTPPLPQEKLLLMLLTDTQWQGAQTALSDGLMSAEIVKDFLDYLLFAGSGAKIARQYGINLSVQYEKQAKGFGVKKDISDKARIGYEFEQLQTQGGQISEAHHVGGEYKMTENISLGAEKALEGANKTEEKQPDGNPEEEDKVFIKFKKAF